jgi:hypothetical protein
MVKKATERRAGRPLLRNAYDVQLNLRLNRKIVDALKAYAKPGDARKATETPKMASVGARVVIIRTLMADGKIKAEDLPE